jgi:hypothetical protein
MLSKVHVTNPWHIVRHNRYSCGGTDEIPTYENEYELEILQL